MTRIKTSRIIIRMLALLVSVGAFASDTRAGRLEIRPTLLPGDLLVDGEEELTLCLINEGDEGSLESGDHFTLTLPLGSADDDLALDGLTSVCQADPDWTCSISNDSEALVFTLEAAVPPLVIGTGSAACFDLSGLDVNLHEGRAVAVVEQHVNPSRARDLVESEIPVVKGLMPSLHHGAIAGGELRGSYPNPEIADSVIDEANLTFDPAIQAELDAEAAARASADDQLEARIATEEVARADGDSQLQSNIDDEASSRATADEELQVAMDLYILGGAQQPFNSAGNSFSTVQGAIDDLGGNGWVYVPAGTYEENVLIDGDDDGLLLFGAGMFAAVIDGGATGDAIRIRGASGVTIRDLHLKTTAGANSPNTHPGSGLWATHGANRITVQNVYVSESDRQGIRFAWDPDPPSYYTISNCIVENVDDTGIQAEGSYCAVNHCIVRNAGGPGIDSGGRGDGRVMVGNVVDTTGGYGIALHANTENTVLVGNRVHNAGRAPAIYDVSGTSTVASNDDD